jgi:hypothetical protein
MWPPQAVAVLTTIAAINMWQPSHKQQAANQSAGEKNLVQGNQAYAASFSQGHLALPPSQKYAICTLGTVIAPRHRPELTAAQ